MVLENNIPLSDCIQHDLFSLLRVCLRLYTFHKHQTLQRSVDNHAANIAFGQPKTPLQFKKQRFLPDIQRTWQHGDPQGEELTAWGRSGTTVTMTTAPPLHSSPAARHKPLLPVAVLGIGRVSVFCFWLTAANLKRCSRDHGNVSIQKSLSNRWFALQT